MAALVPAVLRRIVSKCGTPLSFRSERPRTLLISLGSLMNNGLNSTIKPALVKLTKNMQGVPEFSLPLAGPESIPSKRL